MNVSESFITATKPLRDLTTDLSEVHINEPAIEKKVRHIRYLASTLGGNNKIAWLLKAINLVDLTSLGGDDIAVTVQSLCRKAVNPIPYSFGDGIPLHTAAVCVYPARVKDVVDELKTLSMYDTIRVASVATGFPSGQYPLATRLNEITIAVANGANEIDVVIYRPLAIEHKWEELYNELVEMRSACSSSCMKTILATGELSSLKDVYKASMVAMHAGTDFIKTSTGKEAVNAILPVGVVMCRAIKDYYRRTKRKVGLKPAGGIKTANNVLEWMVLVKEMLGTEWLNKDLFRIGASSVLNDIVNTISHELK